MEKNLYDVGGFTKTTAQIGQIIPFLCRRMEPGAEFDISPQFYFKIAPFKAQVSGTFNLCIKYIKVPMRKVWTRFSDYYMSRTSMYGTPPILRWTYGGAPVSHEQLLYYFPVYDGRAITGDMIQMNALPFRVYRQAIFDTYEKNMVTLINPDKVYETSGGYNEHNEAYGYIGDTNGAGDYNYGDPVAMTDVVYDFYNKDMYTRLRPSQTYDAMPTFGGAGFNIIDLRSWLAKSHTQEKINAFAMKTRDFIANLFGVPPVYTAQTEICNMYAASMTMNDVISTALTTGMPLGNNVTLAFKGGAMKPFKVHADEWCYLMGLVSIVPDSTIIRNHDDEFLPISSPEQFYNPAYANVGYVPVYSGEIQPLARDNGSPQNILDSNVIGYKPIYDELRSRKNWVAGAYSRDYHMMITHRALIPATNINGLPDLLQMGNLDRVWPGEYDYLFASNDEPQVRIFMSHEIMANRPVPRVISAGSFNDMEI